MFSLAEYAQPLRVPQRFIMPAIDPFSLINREMSRPETTQHLKRYDTPRDLPLVVQAGRFDKWKDPQGGSLMRSARRIFVIAADDALMINALQRRAAVVLQKSLREGFGLTVSEAMWKSRAVIGGDVGGIRHQIVHGQTSYLVSDVDQTATRIATLLLDRKRSNHPTSTGCHARLAA